MWSELLKILNPYEALVKEQKRKLRLYFYEGKKKVYVKFCGDGTDATAALDEAREWCKANCEDKGIMDYYLMGNKIWLEYY